MTSKILEIKDKDNLLIAQKKIQDSIQNKDFLKPYNENFVDYLLIKYKNGITIGLEKEGEMIGYGGIIYNIGFSLREKLQDVLDFSTLKEDNISLMHGAGIIPDFEGQGLHKFLIKERENIAKIMTSKHSITKIHKDNEISLDNFEKMGYKEIKEIDDVKILFKNFNKDDNFFQDKKPQ